MADKYCEEIQHALNNTREECKASHDGRHRTVPKLGSCTGYLCKCCNKEIDLICQVCSKPKIECKSWNPYYLSCEECL